MVKICAINDSLTQTCSWKYLCALPALPLHGGGTHLTGCLVCNPPPSPSCFFIYFLHLSKFVYSTSSRKDHLDHPQPFHTHIIRFFKDFFEPFTLTTFTLPLPPLPRQPLPPPIAKNKAIWFALQTVIYPTFN